MTLLSKSKRQAEVDCSQFQDGLAELKTDTGMQKRHRQKNNALTFVT